MFQSGLTHSKNERLCIDYICKKLNMSIVQYNVHIIIRGVFVSVTYVTDCTFKFYIISTKKSVVWNYLMHIQRALLDVFLNSRAETIRCGKALCFVNFCSEVLCEFSTIISNSFCNFITCMVRYSQNYSLKWSHGQLAIDNLRCTFCSKLLY